MNTLKPPLRFACLVIITLFVGGASRGDTLVLTSSDLPRAAAEGVEVDRSGEYSIWVWSPRRVEWTAALNHGSITLSPKIDGTDPTPVWRRAGKGEPGDQKRFKIVVAPGEQPAERHATEGEDEGGKASNAPGLKDRSAKPLDRSVPEAIAIASDADFEPSSVFDRIRGRLDTIDPSPDARRTRIRTNAQGARFKPPATAEAWRLRSDRTRERLLVTLGLRPMLPRTPLNPKVFDKIDRDGYTIEHVVLETLPDFYLCGNLYKPKGKAGPYPAMLCPHGHYPDGRVNVEVQSRCVHWARLGCVVFMYDMVGYNDSKPFGHAFLSDRLRRYGLSLPTLQTWNGVRALDWIASLPEVDSTRIGCTGSSGGGTQTFLLTAIDRRVAMSAPVVMVSDAFQGGCVCENAAGLRIGTDNVEFAALAAPRPMKLVGATGDWTAKTMSDAFPTIRSIYEMLGSRDDISADVFDFPHNYNQTSRNAVYMFLAPRLTGIAPPEAARETPLIVEKPEDLWCFTAKNPAPIGVKSAEQLEKALISVVARDIDKLAPASTAASWEASRDLLLSIVRARVNATIPAAAEIDVRPIRKSKFIDAKTKSSITIEHIVIINNEGVAIPVVRYVPESSSGSTTIIMSSRGKAGLLGNDGGPIESARELLKLGHAVVGFDPLFAGEAHDPSNPVGRRPETSHFDTYNRSLAADRIDDLAKVVGWARFITRSRRVNVLGIDGAGPLVLAARPALDSIDRTAVDLERFDYSDGSASVPAEVDLPGILQFGGLKAAAALVAPAPLWIARPGSTFNAAWADAAYRLADSSAALVVDDSSAAELNPAFDPQATAKWLDHGETPRPAPK